MSKAKNRPTPKQRNLPIPEPEAEPWPTIGAQVKLMLEMRGLSLKQAANMIGMTKQQLFRIIHAAPRHGIPNPGMLTIQKIVQKLGFRWKDFFDTAWLAEGPGDERWFKHARNDQAEAEA
jgi:transcriptional regulator with XRE-family HTH domain